MYEPVVRVLLIADDFDRAETIRLGLTKTKSRFAVQCVGLLADAKQPLDQGGFHVVLADLTLADSHGLEIVRRIRDMAPVVALVVLMDSVARDEVVAALQQGAHDCLYKDCITPELLERSIRCAIRRQRNFATRPVLPGLRACKQNLQRNNSRWPTQNRIAQHTVDKVSHDFRTPLTVITEYATLLRDGVVGKVDDPQRNMLDVIGDRADDLNNMIGNMLDASKLQSGALAVFRKQCALGKIVDQIRPGLVRKAALRKVRLSIAIDSDLPPVFCDPDQVGRMIVNLAVNAFKFCGTPGEVTLCAKVNFEASEAR